MTIKFKIFSENTDTSLIEIALKQTSIEKIDINFSSPKKFDVDLDDIVILGIKDLEFKYLPRALDVINSGSNHFIIVTESQDILLASTLARFGLTNIFVMPQELQKFKSYLNEIIENFAIKYKTELAAEEDEKVNFETIVGNSPAINKTIDLAKKIAGNPDVSVLILGETGTGKGLFAKTIHKCGTKASSPFIDIVCTAIPVNLLESELFGYERGAFTDAKNRKIGLFELAEDGTIFLDEIGDLSLDIQVKLLRAIDDKVIRRLGSTRDIWFKARIISATNRNLENLVEQSLFRIDLYHRLNVITIEIPPLRERGNDVILLAEHFIKEMAEKFEKPFYKIGAELRSFLLKYNWPGNIRELRNAIERGVLLSDDHELKVSDLFQSADEKKLIADQEFTTQVELDVDFEKVKLESLTEIYAQEVLQKLGGNKSKTAKILGISRPKLDKLLKS
ncbi:sigma-54 interaction domain-containing protein [Bacteroidota bacterium]